MSDTALVTVSGVSKKFTRHPQQSFWYGLQDVAKAALGLHRQTGKLRPDEFWAVKDVSFALNRGEILGVVGRNGSGKTTLMRLIAGIYPLDSGAVSVNGRILAMFTLKTGMYAHLTGRQNIYLKGYLLNLTKKEIDKHIDEIIEFTELGNRIDQLLGSYSDGMRARIGFAIATCVKPDIFIIDEALSVGDQAFRQKCFLHLQKVAKETAVLFVTNNTEQAEMLATKILMLRNGETAMMSSNVKEVAQFYHTETGIKETTNF